MREYYKCNSIISKITYQTINPITTNFTKKERERERERVTECQIGSLDKFVTSNTQNINRISDEISQINKKFTKIKLEKYIAILDYTKKY